MELHSLFLKFKHQLRTRNVHRHHNTANLPFNQLNHSFSLVHVAIQMFPNRLNEPFTASFLVCIMAIRLLCTVRSGANKRQNSNICGF